MNLMSERKVDSSRFTSYIDDGSFEIDLSTVQEHRRKFLDGEQLIHQSQNVVLYEPFKVSPGLTGLLTITTFKLSFTPISGVDDDVVEYCQKSSLLGPYEVCLSSIDTIYHVTGSNSSTRKKLSPCQNVSGKIKELQIVCKNMRVLWFSFKNTDKDSGRQVTNTLLHHVYPKRHSLLFAYDFLSQSSKHPNGSTPSPLKQMKKTRLFRSMDDWNQELERTSCTGQWRITLLNESFDPCPHLPRYLVVPKSVTDSHLLQSLRSFRNEGFPVWTWAAKNGVAALVRMAELLAGVTDRTQENTLMEKVRESHPNRRAPEILYLDRDCPSPAQVRLSYLKVRDMCTPTTWQQLRAQDARFYSLLEASRWLQHVSQCLKMAVRGAQIMLGGDGGAGAAASPPRTVVLQEGNGQDMNCVVAALIQILLDPYARTIHGFQSLLQKEFISIGHPFSTRLGHVYDPSSSTSTTIGTPLDSTTATQQSPLLLLYLDCVYQLLVQFPVSFQYTSTYLCTVWDSAHLSAYETFLFNSEHARVLAERDRDRNNRGGGGFRSVWEWTEQFPRQRDVNMFCNALYDDSRVDHLVGTVRVGVQHMEMWSQCYFRWLPGLEIRSGGCAHADVAMRYVANEINTLRRHLTVPTTAAAPTTTTATVTSTHNAELLSSQLANGTNHDDNTSILEYLSHVNSFFPFSVNNHSKLDKGPDSLIEDGGGGGGVVVVVVDAANQPDIDDTQAQISS